jgi:hypothetical protein
MNSENVVLAYFKVLFWCYGQNEENNGKLQLSTKFTESVVQVLE